MLTPEEMEMQAEALAAQQLPSNATPMEQREMMAAMKAEVLRSLPDLASQPSVPSVVPASLVATFPTHVPPRPGMAQLAPVPLAQQGRANVTPGGPGWGAADARSVAPVAPRAPAPQLTAGHPRPQVVPPVQSPYQGHEKGARPARPPAPVQASQASNVADSKTWKSEPFVLLGDVAWFPVPKPPTRGDFPVEVNAEDNEALTFLRRVTSLMACELTDQMLQDPEGAAFAEAARLLMAVLGFMCEGNCPPMLRGNVVTRAPFLPAWQGVVPHMVLREPWNMS